MSQDPSIPSDQTRLPQRHRVSLEQLRKDAVEADLWDMDEAASPRNDERIFDEPLETPEPHGESPSFHHGMDATLQEASPIQNPPDVVRHADVPAEEPSAERPRSSIHDDIGDLGEIDDWDDGEVPMPVFHDAGETRSVLGSEHPAIKTDAPPQVHAAHHTAEQAQHKKTFTRNELIAMASVFVMLVCLTAAFMISALGNLPRAADPYAMPDLPAKGEHFHVIDVRSYWRVPVAAGPDADTVQRGTELIPVVVIVTNGDDAALRVQFRNSAGMAVGDPITRAVRGETKLEIPSTAGLEDINIHNAYRTGLVEPWTVEILEASAGTTAGSSFRSLITLPISSDRK